MSSAFLPPPPGAGATKAPAAASPSSPWPRAELTEMGDEERPFDPWEKNAEAFGLRWQDVTVKKYRRSAAGQGQTPPKRLRTDATLHRTVQFLLDRVVDADASPSARLRSNFGASGGPDALDMWLYVWDRMRAVRVDYAEQRFGSGELSEGGGRCSASCVAAFEKMARFHIVTHHELLGFASDGGGAASKAFATYLKHSADAVTSTLATLWALYRQLLWSSQVTASTAAAAAAAAAAADNLGQGDRGHCVTGAPPAESAPPAELPSSFLGRGLGLLVLWNMDTSGGLWLQGFVAELARIDRTARAEALGTSGGGGGGGGGGVPKQGLLRSGPVVFALAVVAARRRRDFTSFFRLLRQAPYLEACAMAPFAVGLHLTSHAASSHSAGPGQERGNRQLSDEGMWGCAVRALQKALPPGRGVPARVPLSFLTGLLCTDDDRATASLLQDHGVECDWGSGGGGGGGGASAAASGEGPATAVATTAAAAARQDKDRQDKDRQGGEGAPPVALFVKPGKGAPESSFVPRPNATMSPVDAASRLRPMAAVLEKRAGRSRREICTAATGPTRGRDDDESHH